MNRSDLVGLALADGEEELEEIGSHVLDAHPWLRNSQPLVPLVENNCFPFFIAGSTPYAYNLVIDQFFILGDGSIASGIEIWKRKDMSKFFVSDHDGLKTGGTFLE